MHLRNVEFFCEVVRCRSFSRAAEHCHVSQSAVSQAVNALERRLGARLIDRSTKPVEVTPAGQLYFDGCREMLQAYREVEDRVQQMGNRVTGRVRAALIYSVSQLQFDAYVKRFEEIYPDVTVQMDDLHPDEVYARVLADEADLGIVSFPRSGGDVACIPWQEQEMVLVVPPGHRLAGKASALVSELDGEELVGFTADLKIRRQIDRWLRQAHVSVDVVRQFDNIENIKRVVEAGAGVALLPRPNVRAEVEAGALRAVRLADVSWTRPLGIVHKRHKSLTTAARKFVELLVQDAGRDGDRSREARTDAAGNGASAAGAGPKKRPRASRRGAARRTPARAGR